MPLLGPPSSWKAALAIVASYAFFGVGAFLVAVTLGCPPRLGSVIGLAAGAAGSVAIRRYWPNANHSGAH